MSSSSGDFEVRNVYKQSTIMTVEYLTF